MKILKSNSRLALEHNQKKGNFISSVVDHIFLICQEDNRFKESSNPGDIDKKMEEIEVKLNRQNGLLTKSMELKGTIKRQISDLDDQNMQIQSELLESLGSEL